MKSHLERLQEQEVEAKNQKNKNIRMARLLLAFTLVGFAMFSFLTVVSTIDPKTSAQAKESVAEETVDKDSWELILVNRDHVLPTDFTVDLIKFEDTRVDYRISEPLQSMIDAAKQEGINIAVCSGFRTVSEQDSLYSTKCLSYVASGYSDDASKILTLRYIQPGGTSEHHTGLAVDLVTDGSYELDESFADTPAYSWLKENAAKYGFIERYPEGKSDFTGILWEPWHYRYVGVDNASAISSKNLCLEEFLSSDTIGS